MVGRILSLEDHLTENKDKRFIKDLSKSQSKGLFTWREGAPANRATLGEPTFL